MTELPYAGKACEASPVVGAITRRPIQFPVGEAADAVSGKRLLGIEIDYDLD